jgi:hypothetical protein
MAKNRYASTEIFENSFGTFSIPIEARGLDIESLFRDISTFEYCVIAGDRMDLLAAKFLGESSYWWIIALMNNIIYPFASGGFTPGRILKIPLNPIDVFDKIFVQ